MTLLCYPPCFLHSPKLDKQIKTALPATLVLKLPTTTFSVICTPVHQQVFDSYAEDLRLKLHQFPIGREMLIYEPFNHKRGSVQRGESWKLIAESLNSLDEPNYTVTRHSLREKYTVMEKNAHKFRRKGFWNSPR